MHTSTPLSGYIPVRRDPRAGDDASDAAAAAAAAAAASGTDDKTLLSGADDQPFAIPEKFMVKGADDQPDFKAIIDKMGKSYQHMERRMVAGDVPPKSADEYKLEKYLPDGMEPNEEAMKPILGGFHKLGLTNTQVQGVMSLFGEQLAADQASEKAAYDADMAALKTSWGDQYPVQIANSKAALAAYTAQDKELGALLSSPKYANDPAIIKLLAIVGADLNEDSPPNMLDGAAAESIDEIRKSKAYTDPKDPGHADAVRKVTDAYAKGYKANRS